MKLKKTIPQKKIIKYLILLIIFLALTFFNTFGKKAGISITEISRTIINTVTTNIINYNIKLDILSKYQMNDLIEIIYQDKKITNINYNLDTAYQMLINIKNEIINHTGEYLNNIYNYPYQINNNQIILSMPFYNYSNNYLISNLGPKIEVQMYIIKLIDCNIKTKVKTYGINSLLIDLYLNFNITNSIVIPNLINEDDKQQYEILISSKVIQGEIPSIYNGIYEKNSDLITSIT